MASTGTTRKKSQSFNVMTTVYSLILIPLAANGINIGVDFDTWYEVFTSGELWTAIMLGTTTVISLVTKIIEKVKDSTLWNWTFLYGQNFLTQAGTLLAILVAAFGLPFDTEAIFLAGIANGINFLIHWWKSRKIQKNATTVS